MRISNKFCLKGPDNVSAQPSLHQHLQKKILLKESTDPTALYERHSLSHSLGTEDSTEDVREYMYKGMPENLAEGTFKVRNTTGKQIRKIKKKRFRESEFPLLLYQQKAIP